ncbi:ABC transporter substrate-binding protein [Salinispirillum marinum]|uniref:ABC transporter substrate-binding protein n=2 Tax=Saccharospirillaceae TaxID=255527 RepID=A0ABV8BA88_9GAMM
MNVTSLLVLVTSTLLCVNVTLAQTATRPVTIACGAVGAEYETCEASVRNWERLTGHRAQIIPLPDASNERLDYYQSIISANSPELDILQLDVVWAGLLGSDLVDLKPHLQADDPTFFAGLIANNTTATGELIALPWFIDSGLLYYRKDLLEKYNQPVPKTWTDLERIAQTIMAQESTGTSGGKLWGYVWQGDSYEGLTCDALEWFHSSTGTHFVENDMSITILQPGNIEMLDRVAGWIGTISPPETVTHNEEASRAIFQAGDAVFMRNWPYAWGLAQQADSVIAGNVGMAPLPRGTQGSSSATLGGWQLGVSQYSENQALAIDLVRYLVSEEEQKNRALLAGYNPSIPALYEDQELMRTFPEFAALVDIFQGGVPRPATITGRGYPLVSRAIQRNVHRVLTGEQDAETALRNLNAQLTRLSHWYGQQPLN